MGKDTGWASECRIKGRRAHQNRKVTFEGNAALMSNCPHCDHEQLRDRKHVRHLLVLILSQRFGELLTKIIPPTRLLLKKITINYYPLNIL